MENCGCNNGCGLGGFDFDMILWVLIIIVIVSFMNNGNCCCD